MYVPNALNGLGTNSDKTSSRGSIFLWFKKFDFQTLSPKGSFIPLLQFLAWKRL